MNRYFPEEKKEKHESDSCPKRIINCEYCEMRGEAEYREEHLECCDEFPVSCPNECGAKLPRGKLSKHRSECELELIPCPYKEYGCRAESMLRRDLLAHKKEFYIEHQDMSLVRFQSEIKQLKLIWMINPNGILYYQLLMKIYFYSYIPCSSRMRYKIR